MKKRLTHAVMGMFALAAFAVIASGIHAAQFQPQDGVEAQTRGPVHEAYAAPQSLDPKPSPIVPKMPPTPVPELPPDEKPEGSHVVWISGYWAWDDDTAQFLWVSGFWRDVPPGKRWVPGNWLQAANGWQYTSGFWAAETQTQVNYLPPPPPTVESGPSTSPPAIDHFYNPGCWIYVDRQYRWRPGFWLKYQPRWVFTPAHYVWTPAGCVFVEGHWDYELTRRGLLFCPIRFTANVWARPGWRLSPRFIVYPDILVDALFVRVDFHRFCFGDYFGASYVGHGFVPWVDYRLRANIREPLFHQYAWANRVQPNWERDFRKHYDDRRLGLALRPPRSFAEQERFMRELALNKAIKVGERTFAIQDLRAAEKRLTMVNTLAKVDRKVIPLRPLTPAARDVIKTIEHHEAVKVERKAIEKRILAGNPPVTPKDLHQVGTLPAVPKHLQVPATVVHPVTPMLPKHMEKTVPKYELPKPLRASPQPLKHSRIMPDVEQTASLALAIRASEAACPTADAYFRNPGKRGRLPYGQTNRSC